MAFPVPVAVPRPRPILRLGRLHLTPILAAAARNPGPQPLPDELQLVADVRSPHNHIRVADVSPRAAGHPLAGARLLLLDGPGNIHSVSFPRRPYRPLTSTYFDAFATLPPLLPRPPLAVLGFGAGSAARALLHFYPDISVHGWELDPSVIAVARDFFSLAELEKDHAGRLFIHVGDALEAEVVPGGFGGVLVDLFANGSVLPELQKADTWRQIGGMVAPGGRVMVNCGGGCVEAEEEGRDGEAVKDATLRAMAAAFGEGMVAVLSVDESWVAMTGPVAWASEAAAAWKARLPPELGHYVDMWKPYNGNGDT
ncbi:putative polyamine aminopropyl transferase [Hordeum vulgare]|nr:putative polyamine aminopropyl transferase [Hordeum vulgare]